MSCASGSPSPAVSMPIASHRRCGELDPELQKYHMIEVADDTRRDVELREVSCKSECRADPENIIATCGSPL